VGAMMLALCFTKFIELCSLNFLFNLSSTCKTTYERNLDVRLMAAKAYILDAGCTNFIKAACEVAAHQTLLFTWLPLTSLVPGHHTRVYT
jgi:hypothetical protein